ncbi:MAG: hypothetical protein ACOCRA_04135, partial [Halobacteria archaeon]
VDPSTDEERRRRGEDERLLDGIRRYVSLHNEKPSADDLRATDWMASPDEYREVFGGVEEAVAEAFGDEEDDEERKEELVSEVRRYYLREGDVPDSDDVRATDWMSSVETYREAFGGVRDAIADAGIRD